MSQPALKENELASTEQVRDFYNRYMALLDDGAFEAWPDFFTETCLYRITTRENWEGGFPLSTVACESRAMLADRAAAINSSMMFAPRAYRRFQSALLRVDDGLDKMKWRSNFLVVQTLLDRSSQVAFCGVAFDTLMKEDGALKFRKRICVMDTEMIPNSLIYPL